MIVITKKCCICKEYKILDLFSHNKNKQFFRCGYCKECRKKYYAKNKKRELETNRKYVKEHKEHLNKKRRETFYGKTEEERNKYYKKHYERRKNVSEKRLQDIVRSRIHKGLKRKGFRKIERTVKYLGISFDKYKDYLEHKFTEGMSWDNYGKWHIDHIIPLASAKSEKEVIELLHYTNTQPLWALDNIRKGDSLFTGFLE